MQECDAYAAEHAVMMFRDHIRRLLSKLAGYECQEANEGDLMLAFTHPMQAINFCLLVMLVPSAWFC